MVCLLQHTLMAQDTTLLYKSGWGVPASFCKPFLADINSTITSVGIGVNTNHKEYDLSPNRIEQYKPTVETNLGVSIPVYTRNFHDNRFGLAFSMPIHFHIWLDLFEQTTAPVLNTDYSFALMEFKYIQRFNNRWLHSYGVKFIPFYHQSTHLGDELTIYRKDEGISLTRVNVSYNYWELSLWVNEAERKIGYNNSFRFGLMGLLNPSKGWYSVRPEEGVVEKVTSSTRPVEFYMQYQLQTGRWLLSRDRWQNVFSVELRSRAKYNYPYYRYDEGEWSEEATTSTRWNVNLYYGWRLIPSVLPPFNNLGVGIQAYLGVNPHGQFRNIPNYRYVGFTLMFE